MKLSGSTLHILLTTIAFGSMGLCASSGYPAAGKWSGSAARGMSRAACSCLSSARDSRRQA